MTNLQKVIALIDAARCPESLRPAVSGNWKISRRPIPSVLSSLCRLHSASWQTYTILTHRIPADISDLHVADDAGMIDDVVMEDSSRELRKHLPIWLESRGRVLVTGLGLGCVVRGLLANRAVDHVDVIEIDADIIRMVGAEFIGNPRVAIHRADAFKFQPSVNWDFAWHDIWTPRNEHLHSLHAALMVRFRKHVGKQGAWQLPRPFKRSLAGRIPLVGAGSPGVARLSR